MTHATMTHDATEHGMFYGTTPPLPPPTLKTYRLTLHTFLQLTFLTNISATTAQTFQPTHRTSKLQLQRQHEIFYLKI